MRCGWEKPSPHLWKLLLYRTNNMESIISIGIDIGTTTTSIIFSRIYFNNTAVSYMAPKVDITDKEILYRSEIFETPILDEKHLDGEAIERLVAGEYEKANLTPSEVGSGAVIITGESLLKENAEVILKHLSDYAGEFVVATAGPDLEAIIAGKGSGVQEYTRENNCTAANIDIGGGTSNIAVFSYGELVGCTSLDIGGRLLTYDNQEVIRYVSPRINDLVRKFGFTLVPGEMTVKVHRLKRLTDIMCQVLEQAFVEDSTLTRLMLTKGSRAMRNLPIINGIALSGGVADCFYQNEEDVYKYHDLGVSLAHSLKESNLFINREIIRPNETIRATVVGAGIYTMTVSGSTITYSDGIFPIKNIPVFPVDARAEEAAFQGHPEDLVRTFLKGIQQTGSEKVILYLKGLRKASYKELCNLAEALACCSDAVLKDEQPLMIITEHDMAKSLGQAIERFQQTKRDIICMDGLKVNNGDYIDIGKPIMNGLSLPVVVKTLVFEAGGV